MSNSVPKIGTTPPCLVAMDTHRKNMKMSRKRRKVFF